MPAFYTVLLYVVIFLYGIIIGSFVNVCILRVPAGESLIPGSHCTSCGHRLAWYDLFPLFSYLSLKGRCRYCGAKISCQYPIVEALDGVLYVIVFMANGISLQSVLFCLMASALLVISVVDWRTFEIPPGCNLFLLGLGVIFCILDFSHIGEHLIGLVCVSGLLCLLYLLTAGRGIGGGDIKLMGAAGLILGWKGILLALFFGCALGSVIHLIRMKVFGAERKLAMGPYLSGGILIAALWGDALIRWYVKLALG